MISQNIRCVEGTFTLHLSCPPLRVSLVFQTNKDDAEVQRGQAEGGGVTLLS